MAPKVAPKAAAKAAAAKAKAQAKARPIRAVQNGFVPRYEPPMPALLRDLLDDPRSECEPDTYGRAVIDDICGYLSNAHWSRIATTLHVMLLFRPKLLRKVAKQYQLTHADNAMVRVRLRMSQVVAVSQSGVVHAMPL